MFAGDRNHVVVGAGTAGCAYGRSNCGAFPNFQRVYEVRKRVGTFWPA